jgi:large subunit ribosomal protein L19
MSSVIEQINAKYKKSQVVDVRSGDTVKVHQKIKEGNKERVQVFEGLVIRTDRKGSHTSSITVRRIASGVGVEKSYLLHSPLVLKVEVTKRSKVRRNYLSYMRERTGKSARLSGVEFDRQAVNTIRDEKAEAEEAKMHEEAEKAHEAEAAKRAEAEAKKEAKVEAVLAQHDQAKEEAQSEATNEKPTEEKKEEKKAA